MSHAIKYVIAEAENMDVPLTAVHMSESESQIIMMTSTDSKIYLVENYEHSTLMDED